MKDKLLGATVLDAVTGFAGIVTGYVTYLSGCNQALVVPKVGADGKLPEPQWFDEQRLRVQPEPMLVLDNTAARGFDKAAPKR
jgi:hypothetical protein